MRLIDADELRGIESLLDTDIIQASKEASWLMSQVLHDIDAMPTIDPETLPIVRQLREELALITQQRDIYKSVFERITAHGDCNDCEDAKGCRFAPRIGEDTRYNCPLWRGPKKDAASRHPVKEAHP